MTAAIHGDKPRPWVMLLGANDGSPLAATLREVAGHVRATEDEDEAGRIRQSEYDAAVVVEHSPVVLDDHLNVIQFGGHPDARSPVPGQPAISHVLSPMMGDNAERFEVGEAARAEALIELAQTLLPPPDPEYLVLAWALTVWSGSLAPPDLPAFAREHRGRPLAVRCRRRGDEPAGELWWLPDTAVGQGPQWVKAAFRSWAAINPEVFGRPEEWRSRPEWMTAQEREAKATADAFQAQFEEEVARLEAELEGLRGLQEEAGQRADAAERRLLTTTGDPLVEEVSAALRELGFEVLDADALPEHATGKQEDLRVLDNGWVALAEVKGHGGRRRAKEADLQQVQKAETTYAINNGKRADALWYVVNNGAGSPPDQRPPPLAGSAGLAGFAEDRGLVVDTRDLFRLREAVRAGHVAADAARALLKGTTGIFAHPS